MALKKKKQLNKEEAKAKALEIMKEKILQKKKTLAEQTLKKKKVSL